MQGSEFKKRKMNIDLQIMLENLISENRVTKKPINIPPEDFCDLLSNGLIIYQINQKIKFKNPPIKFCDEGYSHELHYEGFKFYTITTLPISDI